MFISCVNRNQWKFRLAIQAQRTERRQFFEIKFAFVRKGMERRWRGHLFPRDQGDDGPCHAPKAMQGAFDEIVRQEEVLFWEPVGRTRRKEPCYVRSTKYAILACIDPRDGPRPKLIHKSQKFVKTRISTHPPIPKKER